MSFTKSVDVDTGNNTSNSSKKKSNELKQKMNIAPINIDNKQLDNDIVLDSEFISIAFQNKKFTESDIEELKIVKNVFKIDAQTPFEIQADSVYFGIPQYCDITIFTLKDALKLYDQHILAISHKHPLYIDFISKMRDECDKINMLKFHNRNTQVPYNISNYFVVKFTMRRRNQEIIFGMLYGYNEFFKTYDSKTPIATQLDLNTFKDQKISIAYDWLCMGLPFDSKDGEYRDVMANISTLSKNMSINTLAQKLIHDIVNYIKEKLTVDDLVGSFDILFPVQGMSEYESAIIATILKEPFKQFVRDSGGLFKISIYDFCIAYYWLRATYIEYNNLHIENMFKKYQPVFFSKIANDFAFFKTLIEKYTMEYINYTLIITSNTGYDMQNSNLRPEHNPYLYSSTNARFGQKLIQITVDNMINIPTMTKDGILRFTKESEKKTKYKNYQMGNWLELNSNLDLNLNYNIPITGSASGWFFIKNKRLNIFENEAQVMKVSKSELAKRALAGIKSSLEIIIQGKVSSKEVQSNLEQAFERMLRTISSNNIMNIITSYDGVTLYDYKKLIQNNKYYQKYCNIFENKKQFMTFMLLLLFSNVSLSRYLFHKDLHLNNIVIQFTKITSDYYIKFHSDPDDIYVKHPGFMPKIIDYSRMASNNTLTYDTLLSFVSKITGIQISYSTLKVDDIHPSFKIVLSTLSNYYENIDKIGIYFEELFDESVKLVYEKLKNNVKKLLLDNVNSLLLGDKIKLDNAYYNQYKFIKVEFSDYIVIQNNKEEFKESMLQSYYKLNNITKYEDIKKIESVSKNTNIYNYPIMVYISDRYMHKYFKD
jgi:hypothetical protein